MYFSPNIAVRPRIRLVVPSASTSSDFSVGGSNIAEFESTFSAYSNLRNRPTSSRGCFIQVGLVHSARRRSDAASGLKGVQVSSNSGKVFQTVVEHVPRAWPVIAKTISAVFALLLMSVSAHSVQPLYGNRIAVQGSYGNSFSWWGWSDLEDGGHRRMNSLSKNWFGGYFDTVSLLRVGQTPILRMKTLWNSILLVAMSWESLNSLIGSSIMIRENYFGLERWRSVRGFFSFAGLSSSFGNLMECHEWSYYQYRSIDNPIAFPILIKLKYLIKERVTQKSSRNRMQKIKFFQYLFRL